MRKSFLLAVILGMLIVLGRPAMAQEKPAAKASEPLSIKKVLVVISEFEGDKRVGSLPYTITASSEEGRRASFQGSMRLGIRVPVPTGNQVQYQNVGTDMDCQITKLEDGRFLLSITIRRTSVYTAEDAAKEKTAASLKQDHPVLRDFHTSFEVILRDGQTGQGTVATDPFSGRVLKVDVTLNVVK
jgi:hypothetical protein